MVLLGFVKNSSCMVSKYNKINIYNDLVGEDPKKLQLSF